MALQVAPFTTDIEVDDIVLHIDRLRLGIEHSRKTVRSNLNLCEVGTSRRSRGVTHRSVDDGKDVRKLRGHIQRMGRFVDCRRNIREEADGEALGGRRPASALVGAVAGTAVENLHLIAEINRLHDKDAVVGALDHDSIALCRGYDRTAASRRAPVTGRRIEDVNRTLVCIGYVERMSCFIQIHDGGETKGDTGSAT